MSERIKQLVAENNRLLARIDELKAELARLQGEHEPMERAQRLADIILSAGSDCIFCDSNKATVHTSAGDFVCERCRDEFEAALEGGDDDQHG